jgi:hypothetical protein
MYLHDEPYGSVEGFLSFFILNHSDRSLPGDGSRSHRQVAPGGEKKSMDTVQKTQYDTITITMIKAKD